MDLDGHLRGGQPFNPRLRRLPVSWPDPIVRSASDSTKRPPSKTGRGVGKKQGRRCAGRSRATCSGPSNLRAFMRHFRGMRPPAWHDRPWPRPAVAAASARQEPAPRACHTLLLRRRHVTLFALLHWVRRRADSCVRSRPSGAADNGDGPGRRGRGLGRRSGSGRCGPRHACCLRHEHEPEDPSRLAPVGAAANAPALAARAWTRSRNSFRTSSWIRRSRRSPLPRLAQRLRRWAVPLSVRYPSEADSMPLACRCANW